MNDTTLASDNFLCLSRNILERISKLILKIDNKIRDEKLQYGINKEAEYISIIIR